MPEVRSITADHFDDLFLGSQLGVLSAASTYRGSLETWVHALLQERPVELVDPAEARERFGEEEMGLAVLMVGAMLSLLEYPFRGDEAVVAVRRLERTLGVRFAAMCPFNCSGPNALVAVGAASLLGLPLVDCDGQGRILPLIDQTTFALGGLRASPLAGVGPWGDVITVDSPGDRAEEIVRAAVSGAGGWMLCATYPAPVHRLVETGIQRSLSQRIASGALMQTARSDLGERLARHLGGRLVARARVVELSGHQHTGLRTRQPASPYSILLRGLSSTEPLIRLEVRNEIVVATVDGAVVGAVPDMICLIDPLRRRSVELSDLRVGQVMEVLVLPAAEAWRTPSGRAMAGPGAFGLSWPAQPA
ncbi:DUF917 domain-containing protein [uncultured Pseudokineococcus sp.]|uniref:DUF917 domain-containing protein n=1 Tax=uncultured Pseudokineococcus sp. TaxID=1642928 RepID=UPI0026297799|nr:DUF917 domain-containing protein [uncultured Pseudokineococcus sp.]